MVVILVAMVSLGLHASTPPALVQGASSRQGQVTVSVLDKDDAPVPGLGEKDFVVREDGVAREIVRVTPNVAPTHVVLLIDDTESNTGAVPFLRDGIKGFAAKVVAHTPAPEIRLTTFGDRPTLRQDFTSASALLTRQADRVFPQTGAGSRLLEGIIETCRDLKSRHIAAATIVAIVNEAGPEFSDDSHTHVEDELRAAGATLWAVVLQDPRGGNRSTEGRERAMVIGDVTRDTGGRNKMVLSAQTLAPALESVGTAIVSQYAITYGRPDRLIPASRLAVETVNRGATVLARRWTTP
jgi:hypothetical protein